MSSTTNNPTPHKSSFEASTVAVEKLQQAGHHFVAEPAKDILGVLKDYAYEKPDVVAMWCFGAGLLIGWKLRG